MIQDYLLEKFPLNLKLRDGTSVVVRPLAKSDGARLHKFLHTVPEEERLFIKQSVAKREAINEWCRKPDFERNLPLLMLHGQKIIGEANLHQRPGGWKRHIGMITLLTHPEYRGRDVSKILVTELIEIAQGFGLRRLEAEVNGGRKIALSVLSHLGFRKLLDLPDYVLDLKAVTHDYVLLGLDLHTDLEFSSAGD
jgi:RimJ/RimL family protein N-acetyltransferase